MFIYKGEKSHDYLNKWRKKCLIKLKIHSWLKLLVKFEWKRISISFMDYKKSKAKIILNGEILEYFPLKSEMRQRCSLFLFKLS